MNNTLSKNIRKEFDVFVYFILVLILIAYAIYLKLTCEGLGCLAVVIPILGIFILSGVEFVVNLVVIIMRNKISVLRWVLLGITGLIAGFAVIGWLIG